MNENEMKTEMKSTKTMTKQFMQINCSFKCALFGLWWIDNWRDNKQCPALDINFEFININTIVEWGVTSKLQSTWIFNFHPWESGSGKQDRYHGCRRVCALTQALPRMRCAKVYVLIYNKWNFIGFSLFPLRQPLRSSSPWLSHHGSLEVHDALGAVYCISANYSIYIYTSIYTRTLCI